MQSKRKTQQFVAAFVISGIVIAALCGFVLVDLSAERYMPGAAAPLFQITEIDSQGLRVAVLGSYYDIESAALDDARDAFWERRNWLPTSARAAGGITAWGYLALRDYLDSRTEPEEPW